MAKPPRKSRKIEMPFLLQEAVKNGRAILFLGAGASKECKNRLGETAPNAEQLRDILSQKYMGKLMSKRTLMSVAEMAIDNFRQGRRTRRRTNAGGHEPPRIPETARVS
jgi:hypothetical protein